MRIQPLGYTFFRDGRVLPRHKVAEDPALRKCKPLTFPDSGYDIVSPRPGVSGAVPRLTLYSADGWLDTVYFGPNYGKQPRTRAEALSRAMGGDLCESCKLTVEKTAVETPSAPPDNPPGRGNVTRFPSVQLFTSCCAGCGRMYISGGQMDVRTPRGSGCTRLDAGLNGQYVDVAV
jgi:hypothetical protein